MSKQEKARQKFKMNFSRTLKKVRCSENMSQSQVANRLKINPTQYASYEQGKRMPGVITLVKIAKTFRVSIDSLLGVPAYEAANEKISRKESDSSNEQT